MSTKYFALLTRLGADKLANAAALGTKIEITHMAVGDGGGSLPTPHTTQAQLINERRRAAINVLSIDPKNTHQIIAEQVIPESEGGWWIREIGLFDKDGILIAVGNCAETYKPQLQEGSGRTQTLRMVLIVSSTDAVTLKIDPAVVLATREYVDSRITNSIKDHENSRRHPDATLKDKGFVILSSAVDSHSETQAATPKAVKVAYDLANAARDNANGRVPATRKVNGKALSSDISLGAGDVGAYTPGEVDFRVNEAKSLANTANQNAGNANNNANARLEKSKNGADILDKKLFVENLGLTGTVDLAKNAAPRDWVAGGFARGNIAEAVVTGLFPRVILQNSGGDRFALEAEFNKASSNLYIYHRNAHSERNNYVLSFPKKSGTLSTLDDLASYAPRDWITGGFARGNIAEAVVTGLFPRVILQNSGGDRFALEAEFNNGSDDLYIYRRNAGSEQNNYVISFPKKSGTLSTLDDLAPYVTQDELNSQRNTALRDLRGWWKCGNTGIIYQWGYTERKLGESREWVEFPTLFPNDCFGGVATPNMDGPIKGAMSAYFGGSTRSGTWVTIDHVSDVPDNFNVKLFYFAMGC
ncbi:phage tail protein [Xenorhabdus bovienii]|uniref:phage tail protein n=1 Tax=Xenorhabdus bovienii TaxID=40576 RepID=UPI002157836B|nr:phage tail protein [Xenorhabdus bovienii]